MQSEVHASAFQDLYTTHIAAALKAYELPENRVQSLKTLNVAWQAALGGNSAKAKTLDQRPLGIGMKREFPSRRLQYLLYALDQFRISIGNSIGNISDGGRIHPIILRRHEKLHTFFQLAQLIVSHLIQFKPKNCSDEALLDRKAVVEQCIHLLRAIKPEYMESELIPYGLESQFEYVINQSTMLFYDCIGSVVESPETQERFAVLLGVQLFLDAIPAFLNSSDLYDHLLKLHIENQKDNQEETSGAERFSMRSAFFALRQILPNVDRNPGLQRYLEASLGHAHIEIAQVLTKFFVRRKVNTQKLSEAQARMMHDGAGAGAGAGAGSACKPHPDSRADTPEGQKDTDLSATDQFTMFLEGGKWCIPRLFSFVLSPFYSARPAVRSIADCIQDEVAAGRTSSYRESREDMLSAQSSLGAQSIDALVFKGLERQWSGFSHLDSLRDYRSHLGLVGEQHLARVYAACLADEGCRPDQSALAALDKKAISRGRMAWARLHYLLYTVEQYANKLATKRLIGHQDLNDLLYKRLMSMKSIVGRMMGDQDFSNMSLEKIQVFIELSKAQFDFIEKECGWDGVPDLDSLDERCSTLLKEKEGVDQTIAELESLSSPTDEKTEIEKTINKTRTDFQNKQNRFALKVSHVIADAVTDYFHEVLLTILALQPTPERLAILQAIKALLDAMPNFLYGEFTHILGNETGFESVLTMLIRQWLPRPDASTSVKVYTRQVIDRLAGLVDGFPEMIFFHLTNGSKARNKFEEKTGRKFQIGSLIELLEAGLEVYQQLENELLKDLALRSFDEVHGQSRLGLKHEQRPRLADDDSHYQMVIFGSISQELTTWRPGESLHFSGGETDVLNLASSKLESALRDGGEQPESDVLDRFNASQYNAKRFGHLAMRRHAIPHRRIFITFFSWLPYAFAQSYPGLLPAQAWMLKLAIVMTALMAVPSVVSCAWRTYEWYSERQAAKRLAAVSSTKDLSAVREAHTLRRTRPVSARSQHDDSTASENPSSGLQAVPVHG